MLANLLFDLEIDLGVLWLLQLNGGLILLVLGTFAYIIASLFDDSTKSYMVTGVVFTLFLMANIVSGFSEQFDWMSTISVFSLFDASAIIQNDSILRSFVWLLGLLLAFMILSFVRFTRKDLTI